MTFLYFASVFRMQNDSQFWSTFGKYEVIESKSIFFTKADDKNPFSVLWNEMLCVDQT